MPLQSSENQQPPREGDDYYYMDGPYLVFTAAYHLKRGYCCGSGCRHCPWREEQLRLPLLRAEEIRHE